MLRKYSLNNPFMVLSDDDNSTISDKEISVINNTNNKNNIFKVNNNSIKQNTSHKRMLCNNYLYNNTNYKNNNNYSLTNKDKCDYGYKCLYAHSLKEQKVDDIRQYAYNIIMRKIDVKNMNLRDNEDLYQIFILFNNVCEQCKLNRCQGGYNCKYGVIHEKYLVCMIDLNYNNCKNIKCKKNHLTKIGIKSYYNNLLDIKHARLTNKNIFELNGNILNQEYIDNKNNKNNKNNIDYTDYNDDDDSSIDKYDNYMNSDMSDELSESIFEIS